MLISRVSEGEGRGEGGDTGEYRTADELFELIARDHGYDANDHQSLSTRDLVILYKNIDAGTKLMSDSNIRQRKSPNQRVETVVYKDDRESDDSDLSEIYSNEDLQDLFAINKERIDLINNISSVQHPLCHKFGNIEIQTSNITSGYDSNFLFKDPYIKQQLENINILPDSTGFDTMLPASLLDYICCKRLEDNYNFYMDNIIRYVQHTIEQLKRISNGDYLTDRAREKWREVAKDLVIPSSGANKVLATSVSIPIHVLGKVDGHRSTWDDMVHSEVDVRSLSKILEKKIIIEVPKLICGSYKLFSERCADNLIISCKKDLQPVADQDKEEKSRVDVVFQLKPSGSGHVISNINSIMILQKIPSMTIPDPNEELIEVTTFGNHYEKIEEHPRIIEIDNKEELKNVVTTGHEYSTLEITNKKSITDTNDSSLSNNLYLSSSQSSIVGKGLLKRKISVKALKAETNYTLMSPDELRCTIRRLNIQTAVPEETEESSVSKKRSPTRVRIKSPYENRSYSIEEKKRKKLLEIRDKREKKKMALGDNCKVTKHKYGKSVVMAQPSSSVTKLSITNKSFYNSIYGEKLEHEVGISKKSRKLQKREMSEKGIRKEEFEDRFLKSSFTAIDRGLDDGTTETIMQMQENLDSDTCATPISALSNYKTHVSILSQLMGSSSTYCSSDDDSNTEVKTKRDKDNNDIQEVDEGNDDMDTYQTNSNIVPANSPTDRDPPGKSQDGLKKTTTPVECRKSIDKIYDLLKNLGKHGDYDNANSSTHYVSHKTDNLNIGVRRSSTIQVSDSGTSVKHHIVSSNPSTFSFEKNNHLDRHTYKDRKKKEAAAAVVPKIMISTKLQTLKVDAECNKTDRKRMATSPKLTIADNPLKAISQLIHEFSNVQKTRQKTHKKVDYVLTDDKTVLRQGSSKKPKQEQSILDRAQTPMKGLSYKERKSRLGQPQESVQISHQNTYVDEKHMSKLTKKNISDIIDEAKEARGEAIRGPSKPYSRLNTLAQPKKSYVQAHNDEYQNKYGRSIMANRLQRASLSAPLVEKHIINTNYVRNRRKVPDTASVPSAKPGNPAVPPLERITRPKRSASNSPARKRAPQLTMEPSSRQINTPKIPDMKKKMVAVESYVKSHYGRVPIDTSDLKSHEVHKSRVPLIPNDIELASLTSTPTAEESTALGNQLHYMVDSMITQTHTNAPALSVLAECKESAPKLNEGLDKLSAESLLKMVELKSESDYTVDIFEDKNIVTAVACIPKDAIQNEEKVNDENIGTVDTYVVQSFNSATELQKLENALYQRMSVGAFPKRLRIKNLTLTPKQSLQQVIVVQSGDAGSLLAKSSLSQCLKTSASKSNSLTAMKSLAAISNTSINWGFTNIPLQVATVGYAFPTFQSNETNSLSPYVQMLMEKPSNEDVVNVTCKTHKTSQCFKGVHTESCLEQAIQANIVVSIPSSSNLNIDTPTEHKEKINKKAEIVGYCEKHQANTKKCERVRPVTDTCESIQTTKEKRERGQSTNEKREIVKPITEKCDRVQPIAGKCKRTKPLIEKCDKSENNTILSKMSLNNGEDIHKGVAVRKPSETVDHSTSLDILVGLLNEIRKITGEASNKNIEHEHEHNSKELEILLNNAATHESSVDNDCRDMVSVSSLHKLNPLHSNLSICSFNVLKNGDRILMDNENKGEIRIMKDSTVACKPKNVDKEVCVDIEKQYVNRLTDVPSCFFPVTISHSTKFTDSVIEILRQPPTPSVYSFAKHETSYYDSTFDDALEEPQADKPNVLCTVNNHVQSEHFNIFNDKGDEKIIRIVPFVESANMKVEAMTVVTNNYKRACKVLTSPCVTIDTDCDPLLKMKRDILVTVYSILVFTVFAALSFPQLFLHVEM